MNAFQICHNTSDVVPFYLPQQLFLKPIARINISLQLPNVKKLGKSVSHWEIMDKIKLLIRPDEFTVLKVTKTTLEFVRFEGELETRDKIQRVLSKIDNKMIKLKDFSDLMRVKAAEWKSDFPHRRVWDDFFSSAKDMDEMKPGQRPDTVYLANLPTKWFVPYHLSGDEDITPSEKIFYRVFEKFGSIRHVDIPICDPYRKKMKDHISGLKISTFEKTEFFEGYVQFKDYIGFTKAMDALRNMKLVHKDDDEVSIEVNIKVDFDKSKHLSEASIRRREIVRDRLVKKAREQEEKDKAALEEKTKREKQERQREIDLKEQKKIRRKLREEKRKAKILEKLEISGSDEINAKIANEEKKLLKVQRKLEAIRLVEDLFRRIQDKNNIQLYDDLPNPSKEELRNFKNSSELEVLTQREKLHKALKGRVMLKTILADSSRPRRYSSSSSNSDISFDIPIHPTGQRPKSPVINKYPELLYQPTPWIGYPPYIHPGPMMPDPYHHMGFMQRNRGFPHLPNIAGPSRGSFNRGRGGRYRGRGRRGGSNYNKYLSETEEDYQKYSNKFSYEHDDRTRKSYSPKRYRRSRSPSRRSRSSSRSRSRTRTRRRSRSYSYRSRSRSNRKSYSRSRSRSIRKSRSRSKHRENRTKSIEKRSRSKSAGKRSRSKSTGKRSRSRSRGRRRTRTPDPKGKKANESSSRKMSSQEKKATSPVEINSKTNKEPGSKSRSREKSVDSSSFMTPRQLQESRARSKSWSSPKDGENKERSWFKSPEIKD